MKVAVLTHFYHPEVGAPQTRLRETVRVLLELGAEVQIITNQPHYPDGIVRPGYRPISVKRETIEGAPVLRLPVVARPNRGTIDRVIDQASFAATALSAGGVAAKTDVILAESPPLFLGASARVISRLARRPYILHVADPWPDYPIELGALRGRLPIAGARWLEAFAYRGASLITTPTEGCLRMIEAQPTARGKVHVLPNAVDLQRFGTDRDRVASRASLGWDEDRVTFVYAGTVGLAQGLATLLEAAALMLTVDPLGSPLIRIVGSGAEWELLQSRAAARGLTNVLFDGPVSQEGIPDVLAASDGLLVVHKRGRLAEAALPTKLVEGLAAGRALIVSANGVAADIVQRAGAGIVTSAEDPVALSNAILEFARAPEVRRVAGIRAREASAQFDRRRVVADLFDLLERVVRSGSN